jgi:outer membrane receptor for ferrienterochelin and colicins
VPDYLSNPNQIIYTNLNGFAVSKGLSLNMNLEWQNGIKLFLGATWMDVSLTQNGIKQRQLLTESVSGVWNLSYTFTKSNITIHYTGNLYGPMLLPLLSDLDDRAAESPYWSLQNIQITKKFAKGIEVYGGVKNILNFTPPANSIARAFDPFDNNVQFNDQGQVIPTVNNPKALTFDPTYVFAPNQGVRMFIGFRWNFYKSS